MLVIYTGTNDIRAGGAGLTPAQSYAQILLLQSTVAALVPGLVTVIGTICDGDPTYYPGFTALRDTLKHIFERLAHREHQRRTGLAQHNSDHTLTEINPVPG